MNKETGCLLAAILVGMPSNYFPTSAIGAINELIISTLVAAEESGRHRWLTQAAGPRIKSLVLECLV